jgi:tetratricopeptide (TPR) repeat protein
LRSVWQQRAELARLLGMTDEARQLERQVAATPLHTAHDHVLLAQAYQAQRRFREALPLLEQAAQLDAQNFWAWYGQGTCHYELGQDVEAHACYNASLALWPDSHLLHFNRALVHQRRLWLDRALADFNKAIDLAEKESRSDGVPRRPDIMAELYRARSVLLGRMGRHNEAVADLDQALELDGDRTDLYFQRATARKRAGDNKGSQQDLETGWKRQPVNALGWTARGVARLPGNPRGALADFESALKLEPAYLEALQNKAHVLSDYLGETARALQVMDRVTALYPDFVPARLGRGVLLARLGKRSEAHADARECLDRSNAALTCYQAANIYALTSRLVPADAQRALPLLARAFQMGFGLDIVDQDSDFAPLRQNRDFRALVEQAKEVQAVAARRLDKGAKP